MADVRRRRLCLLSAADMDSIVTPAAALIRLVSGFQSLCTHRWAHRAPNEASEPIVTGRRSERMNFLLLCSELPKYLCVFITIIIKL